MARRGTTGCPGEGWKGLYGVGGYHLRGATPGDAGIGRVTASGI